MQHKERLSSDRWQHSPSSITGDFSPLMVSNLDTPHQSITIAFWETLIQRSPRLHSMVMMSTAWTKASQDQFFVSLNDDEYRVRARWCLFPIRYDRYSQQGRFTKKTLGYKQC